ncbi:hypothetical protein TVAG_162880 [Trichomonas vaginalis G3]|uniref:Uncharacterized protein n=1 Tax=Trichomonas vaginalis (strain ATCC PRA-98 / G3) TaxID=412133 RepID=A2DFW6_TRIV3|nr:mRNA 3'-end processing [Trichomonas vaginalis G3]EAY20593.1 hypothetical protein TVAG_162880 [Trichomonas vaginalis G3]KAI5487222.1 mRNA 3'-end processing [Trichomonas vaginalis G3]|eukprot:XP_001581579.1 hypothetical protein [Trichomonas vaginalis G3]
MSIVDIHPNYDLRFRLSLGDVVKLKVVEGVVWLFGWQIPLETELTFRDESFTLSSFVPSKVMLIESAVPYYSAMSQIPKIIERQLQKEVIIIGGSKSSGKTTLARWILNTRFIQGVKTFYVNADTYQAPFATNGCIGLAYIDRPIDNNGFQLIDPILLYFGHSDIKQSRKTLYEGQLLQIRDNILHKLEALENPQDVCIVIDYPTIREPFMGESLQEVMNMFGATHFVTLGDDALGELAPKTSDIIVQKLPVLPGALYINETIKSRLVNKAIREYFYGTPECPLKPITKTIQRSEFEAYSLGTLNYISKIMLPSGADSPDPKVLNKIGITQMLNKRILAVIPQVPRPDVWKMNIVGFYCLISVDEMKEEITILVPSEVPPPESYLVAGTIEFNEV